MKKYFIIFISALAVISLVTSCSQDKIIQDRDTQIESRSESSDYLNLLSLNWEDGSYLVFPSEESIKEEYQIIQELKVSVSNDVTDEDMDLGIFNPALDNWENQRNGFLSMRRAYELHSYYGYESGLRPEQLRGIPIINDALSCIVSPDGLVQVGDEIQYFSDVVYASAPITLKGRLREIVEGGDPLTPNDINAGIVVTPRSGGVCNADFDLEINQNSRDVIVNYTGSPISGGDKNIVWSVETGAGNHKNETSFTHHYNSIGEKTICVTYTETAIVTDTTYKYHLYTVDSTYTIPNSKPPRDTTVKVNKVSRVPIINQAIKVICTDTKCRTFELGDCNADFDFTIGFDNEVNFVDKSTTMYGSITGWEWNFGDGETSTLQNPTHKYPCDRDFDVTLIITSDQCPNGQASTSQTVSASGAQCCDKNPQSGWKFKIHPTDNKKRIKYRYDMGTNWNWLFDHDFKAKIKYYEFRKGGLFGTKRWRKTKGNLDVDFDGDVFTTDEEDCKCIEPRTLEAQPPSIFAKSHTFKDDLGGSTAFSSKTHWMKETSPVYITYKVNGTTYVVQNCQSTPGFYCE